MRKLRTEDLDTSMSAIQEALADEKNLLGKINTWFIALRLRFNVEAVSFCCEKFISSELDFQTPGDRGLGRITNYIPRLGGYFRKQMSTLSQEQLFELYEIIQDLMLRGYLTRALLVEAPPKKELIRSGQALYETWLPGMYSSDPSEMKPNLRNALAALTDSAFVKLRDLFYHHGMKGGGFMSKDKTDLICAYYPLGGFGIRAIETGDVR